MQNPYPYVGRPKSLSPLGKGTLKALPIGEGWVGLMSTTLPTNIHT
ncbi:MAG: hypothetical protein MUF58_18235 [Arcicella sp.]|nr:hypothetical protein [Arcicella sp.]